MGEVSETLKPYMKIWSWDMCTGVAAWTRTFAIGHMTMLYNRDSIKKHSSVLLFSLHWGVDWGRGELAASSHVVALRLNTIITIYLFDISPSNWELWWGIAARQQNANVVVGALGVSPLPAWHLHHGSSNNHSFNCLVVIFQKLDSWVQNK